MAILMEISKRFRVNVTQTSGGKKGFECTVEMEGMTMEEVLAESDALVKALEARYPPEPEKKPAKEAPKPPQAEGLGTPPFIPPDFSIP